MKIGDVVRVVKPRPSMGGVFIDVLYEVGWIEEIKALDGKPWAQLNVLRLDGGPGGCGGVPLDCLAPESAPEWLAAKAAYDNVREQERRRSEAWGKYVLERLTAIAAQYGVTPEVAHTIHAAIDNIYESR